MDGDSGRRLDMNHGFLKSIVKNQIDRDEYHKLMMERKEEVERRYAEREREKAIEKRNERFAAAAAARATPSTPTPSSSGGGDSPGGGAQRVRAERADSKGTRTSLYVPPHLRRAAAGGGGVGATASARASVRANAAARRNGGGAVADVCPPCFESLEVTELREKVRSRLRAEMGELELPAPADDETKRGGPAKPLFMLNMTNAGGTLVEVAVMSTDSAARLAKTLGRKHGLNEEQCRMLRLTLEKELDARL